MKTFLKWLRSHDAATAIEYALIAGGIALAILAAIFLMGDSLQTVFNFMASSMNDAAGNIN